MRRHTADQRAELVDAGNRCSGGKTPGHDACAAIALWYTILVQTDSLGEWAAQLAEQDDFRRPGGPLRRMTRRAMSSTFQRSSSLHRGPVSTRSEP
jgi:hypothetical protein